MNRLRPFRRHPPHQGLTTRHVVVSLLLFRRIRSVAACCWMWPDRRSSCGNPGWSSPSVAWRLPVLAPQNRRRAAVDALGLIAARQVIGTVQVAHHRHGGHDGSAAAAASPPASPSSTKRDGRR
jgi:hypothetical protein